MRSYFTILFESQRILCNIPAPGEEEPVPGPQPGGGGGGGDPVPPPTFVPGFLGYLVPRYTCNVAVNEQMKVVDFVHDVLAKCARMYVTQGANGKLRMLNKKPADWGLAIEAFVAGATNAVLIDDITRWTADRSGYLLIDPYTIDSEIGIVSDVNYSTAQNSVSLSASSNITVAGFSGCDGDSTPATATLTVTSIASGTPSNVTLDGVSIDFTAGSGDTTAGIASLLYAAINAYPKLKRRFIATYSGSVVTIKGKFGYLVLEDVLVNSHAAPLANPSSAPVPTQGAAGTLPAGEYGVAYSYVTPRGQTLLSPVGYVTIAANKKIDVASVTLPAGASSINWYVSTAASSVRIRLHTNNNGSAFTIEELPLLHNTLPPELNRTGTEIMRVRAVFSDREEPRARTSRANVLRATYEWSLSQTDKSYNRVDLKYRDSSDDWRLLTLQINDRDHQAKVKKTEPVEINGQAISTTFQAVRIGTGELALYRDADFFYKWSSTRESLLLEEGDVVAIVDDGSGVVLLPVMIEGLDIDPSGAGLPKASFLARKYTSFLYDDSIGDRKQAIFIETVLPEGAVAVPTGLIAPALSDTELELHWNTVSVATGYEYRKDGGSAIDVGNVLTVNVTGRTPATDYNFQIRAYNAEGTRSEWSSIAVGHTDASVTPIALVAHAKATAVATTTSTTSAIDTTGSTLLVMVVAYLSGTVPTISDSKGNTWVALNEYTSGAGNGRVRMYYVKNPTVGSGHTFSAAAGASYNSICVASFNETDTAANADSQNGVGTVSATTQQPGSLTPSINNALLVTGLELVATSGSATIDSGFTVVDTQTDASNFAVALAYKIQGAATSVNPTWTAPGSADRMAASIAAFKHA